jgi:hypothetical protein
VGNKNKLASAGSNFNYIELTCIFYFDSLKIMSSCAQNYFYYYLYFFEVINLYMYVFSEFAEGLEKGRSG